MNKKRFSLPRIGSTAFLAIVLSLSPLLNQPIQKLGQPGHNSQSIVLATEPSLTEAIRLDLQGEKQLEQQQYQNAVQSFRQALALYQSLQKTDGILSAQTGLARSFLMLKDYSQAIANFQPVLALAKQQKFRQEYSQTNLALAFYLSGNLTEAERNLREAIAGWESIRALENNSDLDKVTLFEQQAYTYRLLQKVLVAQKKTDAALEVAERGRSRALVELLTQRLSQSRTVPPNLAQIKQIAKTQNSTLVEYSIAGRELTGLGGQAEAETNLFVWVIQPTGAIAFRQLDLEAQDIKSLTDLVVKAREATIRGRARGTSTANSPSSLQNLHRLLIQPIADLLPKDPNAPVIFIPQDALFLVPFAALPDSAGNYLIQKHTILLSPSIQVLDLTRQAKMRLGSNPSLTPSLVVGNPTMPRLPSGEELPALPGAEREAKAIATLLKTTTLLSNEASEPTIVKLMPQARLIHLATHGLFDLDASLNEFGQSTQAQTRTAIDSGVRITAGAVVIGPNVLIGGTSANQVLTREKVLRVEMPGAIALAPTQPTSTQTDGFLTAKELLGLQLKAELVVLSACDTGRGRITGDGVVGLSRSFIAAGVPSVLVSLWAVPDAPTASLMTTFYQTLQKNPDKAQALRQAMLTTLQQYPSPRDWAPFTLIGEAK